MLSVNILHFSKYFFFFWVLIVVWTRSGTDEIHFNAKLLFAVGWKSRHFSVLYSLHWKCFRISKYYDYKVSLNFKIENFFYIVKVGDLSLDRVIIKKIISCHTVYETLKSCSFHNYNNFEKFSSLINLYSWVSTVIDFPLLSMLFFIFIIW